MADFTFLDHHRGEDEREARRRPPNVKTGWRSIWERWFPSGKDPEIRPQDRAIKKPPKEYFRIPDGANCLQEPRIPQNKTPEII